jgi:hypothetical protein
MIVLEITDDKFGKVMKAISEIGKHSECLAAIFEDLTEESEYGEKSGYGNRKHYDDDDMYGSRYGMRRSNRRSY